MSKPLDSDSLIGPAIRLDICFPLAKLRDFLYPLIVEISPCFENHERLNSLTSGRNTLDKSGPAS